MGRVPCCYKADVKKGPWSPEEDSRLKQYVEKNGNGGNWISLPHKAGLKRCGKSCRLRWLNYLRPNIKHGGFSDEEDRIICALFSAIGSKWSFMAAQLSGRTDNDIKNHWNTKLKKKLMAMASNSSLLQPSDPRCAPLSFDRPISVSFGPFQTLDNLMTSAHYFHSDGSFTQFSHGGSAEIGFTLNNNGFQENKNDIQFNQNPNEYIYSCQDNPLHQLISSSNKNYSVSNIDSLMIMEENKKAWVGKA